MCNRVSLRTVLGCSAVLLAGCGAGTAPKEGGPPAGAVATAAGDVTLHVEGMPRRLGLT
jgi:hypothetical protein